MTDELKAKPRRKKKKKPEKKKPTGKGMNGHKVLCGAKKRDGTACRNIPMENGRCRIHGGKSPGPPVKNKNAVKTGEYESIWYDTLTEDEKSAYHIMDTDILRQIDEEIRLTGIRELRMMERIAMLRSKKFITTEIEDIEGGMEDGKRTRRKRNTMLQVQEIEEALTRVQNHKAKLVELKYKLVGNPNDGPTRVNIQAYLDALNVAAEEVWKGEEDDE